MTTLSPPDTATENIWADDSLNRQQDAALISKFLTAKLAERSGKSEPATYVLNIDSRWGQGKSFFLTRLQKQFDREGHLTAYVNAWEDDHSDDPLVAIIKAVDETFRANSPVISAARKGWPSVRDAGLKLAALAAKNMVSRAGEKIFGDEGFESLKAYFDEEQGERLTEATNKAIDKAATELVKRFDATKNSVSLFRKCVEAMLAASDANQILYVLVDELDRCRPTYAISLLERAKHLFNIDRVVFILATDTEQLRWRRFPRQGSGLAKVDRVGFQAANLSGSALIA